MEIINKYKKLGRLTERDIEVLKEKGIINGIGGKGANLEGVIQALQELPYFKGEKWNKLYEDVKVLSYYHDLDYYLGETYLDFTKANIIFSWRLYKKLWWTSAMRRLGFSIGVLLVLQFRGLRYFIN